MMILAMIETLNGDYFPYTSKYGFILSEIRKGTTQIIASINREGSYMVTKLNIQITWHAYTT